MINVDTDMVIPKQYLKTIKRTGLGKGLFAEARYNDDGSENPDFILNKPAYRKAKILVAGDNFGCGSSPRARALGADGFRHPLRHLHLVRRHFLQQLLQERRAADPRQSPRTWRSCSTTPSAAPTPRCRIDLEKQEIHGPDGGTVKFEIDAFRKHCMLNGLDDIGLTKRKQDKIVELRRQGQAARPWA